MGGLARCGGRAPCAPGETALPHTRTAIGDGSWRLGRVTVPALSHSVHRGRPTRMRRIWTCAHAHAHETTVHT